MNNIYIKNIEYNCNYNKYSTWYINICQNACLRIKSDNLLEARKYKNWILEIIDCQSNIFE